MIDFEKMSKEHEKLFPLADLQGQVLKLEEEFKEYRRAWLDCDDKQAKKEVADILIVCAGIYRWCPIVASEIEYLFAKVYDYDVEEEVNRKWQVNLNRTWEYKEGKYHHVGVDGNE